MDDFFKTYFFYKVCVSIKNNETFIKSKECRNWTQWINLIEIGKGPVDDKTSNKKIESKAQHVITSKKK